MTTKQPEPSQQLRQRAEGQVTLQPAATGELDAIRLMHELQVHQVELEMQNDELRRIIAEKNEHVAHLRNIIQQTPAGYFHVDREGRILDVNDAWLRMHGYESKDEVIGKHFSMMQVDSSSFSALAHLEELKRGVAIPYGEFESRRRDGSVGHHIFSAHPVVHIDTIAGFEWFIIDISERKKFEQKLLDLNEHLLTVQENERLAISRDIHDDFGQNLTVLKLDLEMINLKKCTNCKIVDESLTSMRKNIDLSIAKVQQIASNLRPPLLDSVGLAAAIEWQIHEVRKRSALEFFVLLNEDNGSLDQKASTAMMRIFHEGLTNIVRHSQATEVTVSLCKRDDRLLLELTDNGCGITAEQIASSQSFGLMGMYERARSCGGELRIVGNPDGGTTVVFSIPLNTGAGIV
ncbi:MAG TPA: PAS domain S-box protein [Desulfuromonadales bacterium]|nr:PAS domain S-box protein [Desulfuromonadales bacterium]